MSVEKDYDIGATLVDRLSFTLSGTCSNQPIDPAKFLLYFQKTLYELHVLKKNVEQQCVTESYKCLEGERDFQANIAACSRAHKDTYEQFKKVDSQICETSKLANGISERLEASNQPKSWLEQAKSLIVEFFELRTEVGGDTVSRVHRNPNITDQQLLEAAERVKIINALCSRLPQEKFSMVKSRAHVNQERIMGRLKKCFEEKLLNSDFAQMRKITDAFGDDPVLDCPQTLISFIIKVAPKDLQDFTVLREKLPTFESRISLIFARPEPVMWKLVKTLFDDLIKKHVHDQLKAAGNPVSETYLNALQNQYENVSKLINVLSDLATMPDSSQLWKLADPIFDDCLAGYPQLEEQLLASQLQVYSRNFYLSKGHEKQEFHTLGMKDLRRDLKTSLNITMSETQRDMYEKVLVSRYTAAEMIGEVRKSVERCKVLSRRESLTANVQRLATLHENFVLFEHVLYAIEHSKKGIRLGTKNENPLLIFFEVVQESTSVMDQYEQNFKTYFRDVIGGAMINKAKTLVEEQLDNALKALLERAIDRMAFLLSTKQHRNDFRCEQNAEICTLACSSIANFASDFIRKASSNLDGQNCEEFLETFGMRSHRLILNHIFEFTYTQVGGSQLAADTMRYKEVFALCKHKFIDQLFSRLCQLVSLLVIRPENLSDVCQLYYADGMPKRTIIGLLKLRLDLKSTDILQQDLNLN